MRTTPQAASPHAMLEYRLLAAVCFPFFLAQACAALLMPNRRAGRGSPLARARLALASALPFAMAG